MNINKFKNRLFGRTRGRSKKKINIEDYYSLLNKYKIIKLDNNENYILDVGTGYGESSIYLAQNYPSFITIACEKYIDGNLNLIKKIENKEIKNIRIHPGNVYEILEKNQNIEFFKKVWIAFPDPWPKKKHFKRRLISNQFLREIYSYIKKDGELFIVTDSISYKRAILKVLFESQKYFQWVNQQKVHLSPKDYFNFETKFYKKAIIFERKPSLFILKKI